MDLPTVVEAAELAVADGGESLISGNGGLDGRSAQEKGRLSRSTAGQGNGKVAVAVAGSPATARALSRPTCATSPTFCTGVGTTACPPHPCIPFCHRSKPGV